MLQPAVGSPDLYTTPVLLGYIRLFWAILCYFWATGARKGYFGLFWLPLAALAWPWLTLKGNSRHGFPLKAIPGPGVVYRSGLPTFFRTETEKYYSRY